MWHRLSAAWGEARPTHPLLVVSTLAMVGVTYGIVASPVVTHPLTTGIFVLISLATGVGAAFLTMTAAGDKGEQDEPFEQVGLLPVAALVALFVMPTGALAWATVVSSVWLMAGYTAYRYTLL